MSGKELTLSKKPYDWILKNNSVIDKKTKANISLGINKKC